MLYSASQYRRILLHGLSTQQCEVVGRFLPRRQKPIQVPALENTMAGQNRRDIFDPNEVGAFHAVQRTVRRAWLCGQDPVSLLVDRHELVPRLGLGTP